MIGARCECGVAYSVAEADVAQSIICRKCGRELRLASAEALPDGAGAGDFDTRLSITAGPARVGEQILLGGCCEIEVGKQPERQLSLAGDRVSRLHCKLQRLDFGPSRWSLEDNHSTNGLFVNGGRVASHELKHGDVVQVGDYELKFLTDAALFLPEPRRAVASGGPVCPSCRQSLPRGGKICVGCGIYVDTGRPLVTSKGFDEDDFAIRADTWIRIVSWVIPFGLFPVASEAFGTVKPLATWVILGITVIASVLYLPVAYSDDIKTDPAFLNLMQWSGSRAVHEKRRAAMIARLEDAERAEESSSVENTPRPVPFRRIPRMPRAYRPAAPVASSATEVVDQIYPPWPKEVGFRWYQLFTNTLLHAGVMHLAGNLLFLLVFGLRVNELVGTWKMAVLYPLLGIMASLADYAANVKMPMRPGLGASGAIMGLAGMYFVFFPVQKVRMAIWLRMGLFAGFKCFYKVFAMRGFWLLVLWIGLNDLLPMFLESRDHVAHWAHLGGFASGVALALVLMVTRVVDARRGDLLSVTLGRRAWSVLGRPGGAVAAVA